MKSTFSGSGDHTSSKRIESIDILRGIAIISIVVLHRLHYNWAAAGPGRDIGEGTSRWVLLFLFYMITMAGIFSLITGTVNTYKAYQRRLEGKPVTRQLITGGLSAGLWILALHYAQRIFFANGFTEGRHPIGVLLGWMRTGEAMPLQPNLYYESNALSMIGLVVIIISLLLFLVFKSGNPQTLRKDIRLFIILGTVVLLATPVLRYELGLYKSALLKQENYFGVTLCNYLIGGYGMFPFLSYGFYGAAIGASLASGVKQILIKRTLLMGGLAFFLVGGAGFFLLGGWELTTIFANTLSNQMHWIFFRINQLGFFLLLFTLFLTRIDFAGESGKRRYRNALYPAKVFGMVSLTVFFSEPILAELLKKIWDPLFPGWSEQLFLVILFGLFCLATWWLILRVWWKTAKFTGSLEWLSATVIQKTSGKRSSRGNFE
jgi:uncharacterized membrane protein YidH (DUF202 family)